MFYWLIICLLSILKTLNCLVHELCKINTFAYPKGAGVVCMVDVDFDCAYNFTYVVQFQVLALLANRCPRAARTNRAAFSYAEHHRTFHKGPEEGLCPALGQWTGSRQHCDGRQLVQRLSSLPSRECLIVLYLTNAGQAFVFPYQAVRIPFDEMRRHRVTNLPRGCRWGASENQNVPQGARKQEPRGHRVSTQPWFHSGRSGQAAPEWRVLRTANHLKSNQPQSPRRRETAELFSQSPEHKHNHMREV